MSTNSVNDTSGRFRSSQTLTGNPVEEGVFTATYKYALLLSLADIAVERGDERGTPLKISAEDRAERH